MDNDVKRTIVTRESAQWFPSVHRFVDRLEVIAALKAEGYRIVKLACNDEENSMECYVLEEL